MNTKRRAAFFDFDGTLIKGDSQSKELKFILENEKPSKKFYLSLIGPALSTVLSHLGIVSHITVNQNYLRTYRGFTSQNLSDRGRKLFDQTLQHLFIRQSMDLISQHRQKGDLIILVSATPDHLLEPVNTFIRPDDSVCTHLEFDSQGRCTGKSKGDICIGQVKKEQVGRIASAYGLDLSVCHAYSDHHADLPFLETVGQPTAINPTPRLMQIAKKRNWPVHRFL